MFRKPDGRLMIRCAVCRRRADDVCWRENEHDMSLHIRVRCHGAEQKMTVDLLDHDLVRQLRGQVGVAFEPEPPGPPQLPINQPRL